MKGNAINTLTYTGIVTLSQYIGGKKVRVAQVHNTGGNPLFNFLADCLIGDFAIAKISKPTKVMLLIKTTTAAEDGSKIISYSAKSGGFIYLLSSPEKVYDTESTRVRYSFIIPKDYFMNMPTEAGKELGLGLYTDNATDNTEEDLKKFAAFCSLGDVKNLSSAANNLVVDWDLVISNNSAN